MKMFFKIVSSILLTFVLAVGEVKSLPTTYIADESSGDGSMYYLHKDFLGSITAITNEQGRGVEKRSYDAWGRLRNLYDWSSEEVPPMTILDRGYTGHQHLEEHGLIHMNARLYDPLLGRFLSPDPYVQADMAGTQAFNRYSYCFNNPLKYTDPTGERSDANQWLIDPPRFPYYTNGQQMYWTDIDVPMRQDPATGETYWNTGSFYTHHDEDSGMTYTYYEGELISVNGESVQANDMPQSKSRVKRERVPFRDVWAAMSREEQKAWHEAKIRSREAFLEHPMGQVFMGIVVGGPVGGGSRFLGKVIGESLVKGAYGVASHYRSAPQSNRTTVIGHYPEYTELANQIGGDKFQIPSKIWERMTEAERWAANQRFLDRAINRGDQIRLATPLDKVRPGSYYEKELMYLNRHHYKISRDGRWMIKGK